MLASAVSPSRRSKRWWLLNIAGFLSLMTLAACATNTPEPSPTPAAAASPTPFATVAVPSPTATASLTQVPPTPTPEPERVLRTAEIAGWRQLDPHRTVSPAFFHFFGGVYTGLVRWETGTDTAPEARRVIPDLAESWEQPDATSYLFHLRPEARWQDLPPVNGRRITPADVVFSLQRLRESPHESLWRRIASVQAVGDDAVLITLTEPYSPFLSQLASGVNVLVAQEAVASSDQGDLYDGPVVGTGPFIFDAFVSHRETRGIFRRNPSFYEEGLPRIDRLERVVAGSEELGVALLRAGTIDFLQMGPVGAQSIVDRPIRNFRLLGQPDLTGWAITFKLQPPFDRVEARRAASLALDREAIWSTHFSTELPLWVGLGMPVPSEQALLPAEETGRAYRRDLAEARELVMGLGPAGQTPFTVTVPESGPGPVAAGLRVVEDLRNAGFTANVRLVPSSLYAVTVQTPPGIFDVAFGPVAAPVEADLWLAERFGRGGGFNIIGEIDGELERIIGAQRGERDLLRRATLLQEAQRLLLNGAYQPMVFRDQTWMAVRTDVEGWPASFDEPFQRFLRGVNVPRDLQ